MCGPHKIPIRALILPLTWIKYFSPSKTPLIPHLFKSNAAGFQSQFQGYTATSCSLATLAAHDRWFLELPDT